MSLISLAELAERPELLTPPEVLAPPVGVAGRTTLLTLGPKGGKSTTAAGMLAAASRAGNPCALLALDEALADAMQRLLRFGADPELVFIDTTFDAAGLTDDLALREIRLLAVDHLGKLAEWSPDFGPNSQGDSVLWGRLVSPFSTLARDLNLAVVILDQARRSDGNWAGSTGKGGAVDIIAELRERDGGLICTPRGRVPLPPFRVDLDAEGRPVFSDHDAATPAKLPRGNVLTEAHRTAVLRVLHNAEPDGLKAAEWQRLAIEAVGLKRTAFYEVRRTLYDAGQVSHASRLYHVTPTGERHLANGKGKDA